MSESKNDIPAEVEKNLVLEKALDEEIAKARSNEAATADAVVPAPFFVVHTKHSCDVCFQQPIIGKRFTSSDRKNFDLCARCFDAYSGPEIGLEEAVLARDKKHSSSFVLKLKINNGGDEQVRRISVADIWAKSLNHLSFGKIMSFATKYAFPEGDADGAGPAAFVAKAKVTYIDEDGDQINMTSDAELADAFHQVLKKWPVHKPFRITVTVPNDKPSKVCVITPGSAAAPKRIQIRKVEPRKGGHFKSKTTLRLTPQKFEKDFFIHARHTCDGCSKSPIVGTRHHALKIPDFDLCSACFENYQGEDLDFKPEIHDRDRHMQQKWLKKQLRTPKMPGNIAGMWNTANGDLSDFLKKVQESGAKIESATVYASPNAKIDASAAEVKESGELPTAEDDTGDAAGPLKEVKEADKVEPGASETPSTMKSEKPNVEKLGYIHGSPPCQGVSAVNTSPGSPTPSQDESFLSDADGNGSIAEAIGRTLDVCVAAIEEAMADDAKKVHAASAEGGKDNARQQSSSDNTKTSIDEDVAAAVAVAADTFSVASSMVSSMTDILKKMEEVGTDDFAASAGVHSVATGATILKSEDGTEKKEEVSKVEDVGEEEEWSVVSDDNDKVDHFDTETAEAEKETEDRSLSSVEPLSPVVLAKWDTELHQLHELGFFDDRRNVDVLEMLEASHVAVDSTEKVTVDAAIGRLLGDKV